MVLVDDGSKDGTLEVMQAISAKDLNVEVVELVRNFGKEIATTAGLHHARGDAAIMIDADMQHPVELIREFLAKWEEGADVVVGIRRPSKAHSSFLKRLGSRWFYRIMAVISDSVIKPNATDYRLIDRGVIDEFNRFTERNRVTRGLIDWLGFTHAYVYFQPAERANGTAAYSYFKLFRLALHTVVSMSFFPLRVVGYMGGVIVLVSGPLGVFIFIEKYLLNDPLHYSFTGTAILAVILLFLVGIILICLSLIALYIANIHGEVVNRPLYVKRRKRRRS
jgi:dolichol-phosphate mannosyltransferase